MSEVYFYREGTRIMQVEYEGFTNSGGSFTKKLTANSRCCVGEHPNEAAAKQDSRVEELEKKAQSLYRL